MSRKSSYEDMNHDWDKNKLPKQEEEEEEERDNSDCKMYIRMAIETTLAVGFIIGVTMIVLATTNGYKCCQPREGVPGAPKDFLKIENITSEDARAIVTFSGYLKFLRGKGSVNLTELERDPTPDDFLYLPLNLTHVKLGQLEDGPSAQHQVMNLTFDCAHLSFHLSFNKVENSTISVSSIDIEPNGQQSGYVESSVVSPTAIKMGQAESYVCPFRQEYPVHLLAPSAHKKRMVSIVFNVLNFEVNEEPRDEIKVNQFSKPAHYCYSPRPKFVPSNHEFS